MAAKPKHRWHQFSLRTLMATIVVAALAATWWNHRNYCLTRGGAVPSCQRVGDFSVSSRKSLQPGWKIDRKPNLVYLGRWRC
jgi:hypothetical protein